MTFTVSGSASLRAICRPVRPIDNEPLPAEAIPPGSAQIFLVDRRRLSKRDRQALREGNQLRNYFAQGPDGSACADAIGQLANPSTSLEESQP